MEHLKSLGRLKNWFFLLEEVIEASHAAQWRRVDDDRSQILMKIIVKLIKTTFFRVIIHSFIV